MEIVNFNSEIEPLLPIIAFPEYFKALKAINYGYFIENGNVLPFYTKRKLFFNYMVFTTGILGNQDVSKQTIFTKNVIEFIRRKKIVDFILSEHVTAFFSTKPIKSFSCDFGSYILDITKPEVELFEGLHTKHRNVIKKAIKDSVIILNGLEYFDVCVQLIQETMLRQGLHAAPKEYFKRLKECLGDHVDFWVAKKDDIFQSSAILIWNSEHTSYYLSGGSCEKPYIGSSNLLHWEAIRTMKERGVKYYDFVGARINPDIGSKYEGIQRFKERFGGELNKGFLWKLPINNYKYPIFIKLIKLKFLITGKTYRGDIIDQVNK
jgi:hypothetical protein